MSEIRIIGVGLTLMEDIKIESENKCIPICDLLRPKLREIINNYTPEMCVLKNDKPKEIRIKNVPESITVKINNIASNLGVDRSDFLKMEFKKMFENEKATR